MARTRTPSKQTRIDQAINGNVEDAVQSTDSTRAWANFMNAGDDVMKHGNVSTWKRKVVAFLGGLVTGCAFGYYIGIPLMVAATVFGGTGFIGFVLAILAAIIYAFGSWITGAITYGFIASGDAQAVCKNVTTWVSDKFSNLRKPDLTIRMWAKRSPDAA